MKDLQMLYKECLDELQTIGIRPGKILSITPAPRKSTKTWGHCRYTIDSDTYTITINKRLLQDDTNEKTVKQTIIHEILHACTKCCGHKGKWLTLAAEVNSKLGYNISRTTSYKNFGLTREDLGYKYVVMCEKCGHSYFYRTKSPFVKRPERYRCTCGGHFKSITYSQYKFKKNQEEQMLKEIGYEI